jgi:programmed cell death protein 5
MAMQGKIPERISEEKLVEMLERIGAKQHLTANKISIQRKKYAFDSDDDDNDDDLM